MYEKGGYLKHDLMVMTIIDDPTGTFENGTQIISYGKSDKVLSVSNRWFYEPINGVVYKAYIHEDCIVYSTDFSQFIVVLK